MHKFCLYPYKFCLYPLIFSTLHFQRYARQFLEVYKLLIFNILHIFYQILHKKFDYYIIVCIFVASFNNYLEPSPVGYIRVKTLWQTKNKHR